MGEIISADNLTLALVVIGLAFVLAPTFEGEIPIFGEIEWTAEKKKSSRATGAACLIAAAVIGAIVLMDGDDPAVDAQDDTTEADTADSDDAGPSAGCDPDAFAAEATAYIEEQGYDVDWDDPDGDCLLSGYETHSRGTGTNDADDDNDGIIDGLESGSVPPVWEQLREGFPDGIPGDD